MSSSQRNTNDQYVRGARTLTPPYGSPGQVSTDPPIGSSVDDPQMRGIGQREAYPLVPSNDTTPSGLGLEANQAARLEPKDMLIVYDQRCWQVKPDGTIIKLFILRREGGLTLWNAIPRKDGRIYCTASGSMSRTTPIQYAQFGHWGEFVSIDHINREIRVIARLVDPVGLEFLSESEALVADFNNWGVAGQIYRIHLPTGNQQKLADGGLVTEPYRAHLDSKGVLWIANADGLQYNGEVVRLNPDGTGKIVVRKKGLYSGVICTLFPATSRDKLLGILVDWPGMASSCLFELDKETGEMETVLGASLRRPAVYSPHIAFDGDIVWLAESYHNQLIAFDLKSREIVQKLDITAITGPSIGILDAWDFAECVAIVPEGIHQD